MGSEVSGKSTFTQKMADAICERLANGESLKGICEDEVMPSRPTVYKWLADNETFLNNYMRAREEQADYFAEEILEIADDATNDWMERRDSEGNNIGWQENGEAMQRSRLRVDARKWLMSKMAPKKYGEKSTVDMNVDGSLSLLMQRIDGKTKTLS
jgi:hypothetical protein